jgi:hypothetical protein
MKTHEGSCHCGKVRYRATLDLQAVMACNCSMCSRAGWLLTFATPAQFELVAGESELTDYQFGHKRIHHFFCRHCGVKAFSRGQDREGQTMYAINVRCLAGVDLATLPVEQVDGASIPLPV